MALTLITGPANAGKAGRVFAWLRSQRGRDRYLCLPRAGDVDRAYAELADGCAELGVRAVTFPELLRLLGERLGLAAEPLGATALALVTRAAIRATELRALAEVSTTAGFVDAVQWALAELEAAGVDGERAAALVAEPPLSGARDADASVLRDLLCVHRTRAELLADAGLATAELHNRRLLDELARDPARGLAGATAGAALAVYGFDAFTALERELLLRLASGGRRTRAPALAWEVLVTLPYEAERSASGQAFAAVAGAVAELQSVAARVETLAAPGPPGYYRGAGAEALYALERRLFVPEAAPVAGCESAVEVLLAGGGEAERELVADAVARLLESDRTLDPQEIAVVVRDPARGEEIGRALRAAGIDNTARTRAALGATHFGGGLLALARCALWPDRPGSAEELVRYLRMPGVCFDHRADALEEIVRRRGLATAREARAAFERLAGARPLGELDRLRDAASRGAGRFCRQLDRELDRLLAAPLRGQAAAVGELRASAVAAQRAARATLRELGRLADSPFAPRLALEDVVWGLERAVAWGGREPAPGRVTVAGPEEVGARRWRAVIVTGLETGNFPRTERPRVLLDERQRALLADSAQGPRLELPASAADRERYLFYAACSRASERLVLAVRACDDDGRPLEPSPFLHEVRRLAPDAPVRHLDIGELSPRASARIARSAAAQSGAGGAPQLPVRLPRGTLDALYGDGPRPVGAIARFAQCRVAWLVDYVLRPRPLEAERDRLVLGNVVHAALCELYRELAQTAAARGERQVRPRPDAMRPSREAVRRAVLRALHAELAPARDPLPAPPVGRLAALATEAELMVVRALELDAKRCWADRFQPLPELLEVAFGEDGSFRLGDVPLRGRIDRIDVDSSTGEAVVVDYKTGKSTDSLAHRKWLDEGELQTAIYMLAAERTLKVGGLPLKVVGGVYVPVGGGAAQARGVLLADAIGDGVHTNTRRALAPDSSEGDDAGALEELKRAVEGRVCELGKALVEPLVEPAEKCGSGSNGCRFASLCRLEERRDSEAVGAGRTSGTFAARTTSAGADAARRERDRASATLAAALPAVDAAHVELTDEQRAAVTSRRPLVVVAAGAGVGKTRVLVERYVRRLVETILDGDDGSDGAVAVQRLLAITFTEKAAGEMRARIVARLRALHADRGALERYARELGAVADTQSADDRRWTVELLAQGIAQAIPALDAAPISTLHSFCARLLRREALRAGLDPSFRVVDGQEQRRVVERAFDLALERFLAPGSTSAAPSSAGAAPGGASAGDEGVRRRAEFVVRYGARNLRQDIVAAHSVLRGGAVARPGELAASAGDGASDGRWCRECGLPRLSAWPAGAAAGESAQARSDEGERSRESAAAAADRADFDVLLHEFAHAYQRELAARALLDFADLERRALALLEGDSEVRNRWRAELREVLVDEAQDLNPLQHRLLAALCERVGAGPAPTLFCVGDERQSIYGFRHAEVALFAGLAERAEREGSLYCVDRNFRSDPAIIAAVNHVFRQLWGREPANVTGAGDSAQTPGGASDRADTAAPGGGADTAGSGGQADAAAHADAPPWLARHRDLVAASARRSGGATGGERTEPAVEIVAIIDDTDSRTSGGKRSKLAAATARVLEAELLAERIVELARVDAATDDRERVGGSKPRWGGWALLLRAGSDAAIYERALAARGVPVYNGAGRGFFAQLPVRDALAWLRVLANPQDEEALVEAALSPIGAVPVPTLVRAITAGTDPQEPAAESGEPRARRRGPMWLRLVEAARSLPGDEAGRAAVARFVEMVESERAALGERSLDELVERCLERTGYGAYLLSLPDGQRRVANVRKLALLARAYERVEGRDLRGLCDSLRDLQVSRDLREPEAVLESEGSDSLRFLTIHQSKGLEFDNVVVADLDRQKSRTGSSRLRLRVTPQVAFVLEVPALNEMRAPGSKAGATRGSEWEALAAEIDAREQAETERLIYVAMTRARHRLLLAGRFSPGGERSGRARKESSKKNSAGAGSDPPPPLSLLARTRKRAAQTVAAWLFPALCEGAVEMEDATAATSEERTFAAEGATTITGTVVRRVLAVREWPPAAHPAGNAAEASYAAGGFLLAVTEFRPQLRDERASEDAQASRSGDGGHAPRSDDRSHAPGSGEAAPTVGAAASGAPPARAVASGSPSARAAAGSARLAPPRALAASPPDPGARGAPLPGALAAPVWRRLSYTQLSQFERCAYRYYLERIVRLAPHPDDAVPAGRWTDRDPRAGMRRGRVVHALLERVDARRPDSLPKVEEIAAALVEARLGSGEAVLDDAVSIRRQLERLFAPENPLAARLAGARRVRSELPFVVAVPVERDRARDAQGELGEGAARPVVPITGVFDVYAEEWDDGVLVVDYKTDALAERAPRELFAASHYDLQQRVYALAALRAGAGRVEVAHVFLEAPENPVTQVFVAAHVDSLEADLRKRAERLAAGCFAPTQDPHFAICAACPGRSGLCKWPRERTGALRE